MSQFTYSIKGWKSNRLFPTESAAIGNAITIATKPNAELRTLGDINYEDIKVVELVELQPDVDPNLIYQLQKQVQCKQS